MFGVFSGYQARPTVANEPEMNPDSRPDLALYMKDWCGYCSRVKRAIADLGLTIPLRNIADPEHLEALIAARGGRTVPVLKITHADGREEWMPESRDIIAYLQSGG